MKKFKRPAKDNWFVTLNKANTRRLARLRKRQAARK